LPNEKAAVYRAWKTVRELGGMEFGFVVVHYSNLVHENNTAKITTAKCGIKTTVRLTETEREFLASEADVCGLSPSSLMRRRSLGKRVSAKSDLRVPAELRRMGGLLKHLHNETRGTVSLPGSLPQFQDLARYRGRGQRSPYFVSLSFFILILVDNAFYSQPGIGGSCAYQTHYYRQTDKRFTPPVFACEREQSVFNFVPFARACREMRNFKSHTKLICQLLRLLLFGSSSRRR
jgi:hypothetical protein